MVPGQVISAETIEFMRKLDVKEIHGYHAALGLKLIKPEKLGMHARKNGANGKRNGAVRRALAQKKS
jgi:arginine decarboxylase